MFVKKTLHIKEIHLITFQNIAHSLLLNNKLTHKKIKYFKAYILFAQILCQQVYMCCQKVILEFHCTYSLSKAL